MATKKISELADATAIVIGTDVVVGVQGGTNVKFKALGFVPDQTNYVGSLFIGDGGANIDNTGLDAGDYNTFIGVGSGKDSTISKKNTAVGHNALNKVTSGWANTAVGHNALSSGVGDGTLTPGETAFYANTAVGQDCMSKVTTGSYNTGMSVSMGKLTTGHYNVGIGIHALYSLATGSHNIAIGPFALYYNTVDANTAIGENALNRNVTGTYNTAIGFSAGYNCLNGTNVFIGHNAGINQAATYNSVFIGVGAGTGAVGADNYDTTIIGHTAGYALGDGHSNTFIGARAGHDITTGVANTFIGTGAGDNASQLATAIGSMALGNGAYTTAHSQVVIGAASITETYLGSVTGASKLICSKPKFTAIPTSADGLSSGDVWSNSGVLTIVS